MQVLTQLFWRNPAAAKAPSAWHKDEQHALLAAVRTVTITQQRTALLENFRAQVATGADPAALKGELAQRLEALGSQGGTEQGGERRYGSGHEGNVAALHDTTAFSLMDWQTVAQHVGDRCVQPSLVFILLSHFAVAV